MGTGGSPAALGLALGLASPPTRGPPPRLGRGRQGQLEKLVAKNYHLHTSAREAYRGYILAYNSHQLKEVYNVHSLDLAQAGFGGFFPA